MPEPALGGSPPPAPDRSRARRGKQVASWSSAALCRSGCPDSRASSAACCTMPVRPGCPGGSRVANAVATAALAGPDSPAADRASRTVRRSSASEGTAAMMPGAWLVKIDIQARSCAAAAGSPVASASCADVPSRRSVSLPTIRAAAAPAARRSSRDRSSPTERHCAASSKRACASAGRPRRNSSAPSCSARAGTASTDRSVAQTRAARASAATGSNRTHHASSCSSTANRASESAHHCRCRWRTASAVPTRSSCSWPN